MLRRQIARNAEHAAEHALRIAALRRAARDEMDASRFSEEAHRSVENAERHIKAIRERMDARRGQPMPDGSLVVGRC